MLASFCGDAGRVEADSWAGACVPTRMRAVTAAAVRRKAKVLGLFTPSSCPTRDKYEVYEVKDREADLHIRTSNRVVHRVPRFTGQRWDAAGVFAASLKVSATRPGRTTRKTVLPSGVRSTETSPP